MAKIITKASGEKEPFNLEKFQRSLRKAGAVPEVIEQLAQDVVANPALTTTKEIYRYAYKNLKREYPAVAARYNLKIALSTLGPSGYPFERFVGEIFKEQGYRVEIGKIIPGFCINHEVDVVLQKNKNHILIECKYHKPHLKADVKVPLYIKARFDDIMKKKNADKSTHHTVHELWIVTNTKFTQDATTYGECAGLKLISWSYPAQGNLAALVDASGLHPITVLTSLSQKQKAMLIEQGLILCKDVARRKGLLKHLGLSDKKVNAITQEAERVCALGFVE